MLTEDLDFLKRIEAEKRKRKNIEIAGKRNKEPNLIAISEALDYYFVLDKMRVYCAYLCYRQMMNQGLMGYEKSDFLLIDEVIKLVDAGIIKDPLIHIYNCIRKLYEDFHLMEDQVDERYLEIAALIDDYANKVSLEECEDLYSFLANFCIHRINCGVAAYAELYFKVSHQLLNFRYGLGAEANPILPGSVFKNIVVSAMKLKESTIFQSIAIYGIQEPLNINNAFEWVAAFMKVYTPRLENTYQSVFLLYCQSLVAYEQGDYQKAFLILNNSKRVIGNFISLDVKMLKIKVMYDLQTSQPAFLIRQQENIDLALEAFRGLIRDEKSRKQALNYQLTFYADFERLFRKLLQFQRKYDGLLYNHKNKRFLEDKQHLLQQLENAHHAYNGWLIKKLSEIK